MLPPTRDQRLYELLLSLFNGEELLRFLRQRLSDDAPGLMAELPQPTASNAIIVDAAIHQLTRHGLLDPLFAQLRHGFPRRNADIADVEALWVTPPNAPAATRERPATDPPTPEGPPKRTLARPPSDGTIVATIPSVTVPLWRSEPIADQLIFFPPAEGFVDGDSRARTFQLPVGWYTAHLGRLAARDDLKNEYILPHRTVSAFAATLVHNGDRATLVRRTECNSPIIVGGTLLQKGESRVLHHGQRIVVGRVQGIFVDGRFTRIEVTPQEIDPETGLLARDGLVIEIANLLQRDSACTLVLSRDAAAPQAGSIRLVLALHARTPDIPVGRVDDCAIAVLPTALPHYTGLVSGDYTSGYCRLHTAPSEARARLEECLAAFARLGQREHSGAFDLMNWLIPLLDIHRFTTIAGDHLAANGETSLIALAEFDRLRELDERAIPVLELELFQTLTQVADPDTIYARPVHGVLAMSAPSPLKPVVERALRLWRERTPIGNGLFQVERHLVSRSLQPADLAIVEQRAVEMTDGLVLQLEALPFPLAVQVRTALASATPLERTTALLGLTEAVSRFLAVALIAMAPRRLLVTASTPPAPPQQWLEPWWTLSAAALRTLTSPAESVRRMFLGWFDPDGHRSGWLADIVRLASNIRTHLARRPGDLDFVHVHTPAVEQALQALFDALPALADWRLVAVEHAERTSPDQDIDTIAYVDYTGSFERGVSRRLSLQHSLGVGPYMYLMRLSEGLVVPLEPFMRRRRCPTCGAQELFWCDAPFDTPGIHPFHSVYFDHSLEDIVTARQLPPALRR